MDTNKTIVIFRKLKGEVLALFPYEEYNKSLCVCYAHLGQHSSADYNYIVSKTRPATLEEYADLLHELKNLGYNLIIRKRK